MRGGGPIPKIGKLKLTLGQWVDKLTLSCGKGRRLVMSDMAQFVGDLNVSRFLDKLRVERNPDLRASLRRLLLEEG